MGRATGTALIPVDGLMALVSLQFQDLGAVRLRRAFYYFYSNYAAATMKISYKLIKKIHLYACLSTAALLLMFILTSYVMIHHNWFDMERTTETQSYELAKAPEAEADWHRWAREQGISGRLVRNQTTKEGYPMLEYVHAGGSARITYKADEGKAEVVRNIKSTAGAIAGIHRHSGYGGGLGYNFYAFLLDLLGVGLIVFTITGIIMWFRLLKNDKWAWIIFISGFIYFSITVIYLTYS